jgi:hypothetical protein
MTSDGSNRCRAAEMKAPYSPSRRVSTVNRPVTCGTGYAALMRPLVGRTPSWTANSRMTSGPLQNIGTLIPVSAPSRERWSVIVSCLTALMIPTGMPKRIPAICPNTASSSVIGNFQRRTLVTGCPRRRT